MISGEEAKEAARTIYDYCNQQENCNVCGLWNGKYCMVNYPVAGDVNEKIIHYAEDHIGLADMIGCEIAKEHGYCDTCKHNGGYPKYETCQGCLNFSNYEKGDTD